MDETTRRIWVDGTGCVGCRVCERACPCGAMVVRDRVATIDYSRCISCGMCATKCRLGVIHDAEGLFASRD